MCLHSASTKMWNPSEVSFLLDGYCSCGELTIKKQVFNALQILYMYNSMHLNKINNISNNGKSENSEKSVKLDILENNNTIKFELTN